MKIIALEEHFRIAAIEEAIRKLMPPEHTAANEESLRRLMPPEQQDTPGKTAMLVNSPLEDLGTERLKHMDATGIDVQVLSYTPPGLQALPAAEAVPLA